MELDHLFLFTELPEVVAERLKLFGLTEGAPNIHPGQGTACRRFFFHNAYLELVWVNNEAALTSPVISKSKLWERSQYKNTHYSPFGLCFRKSKQSDQGALFDEAWEYRPPYMPEGLYASVASNEEFPMEPMLFELPFHQVKPTDYPKEKQPPVTHKKGFREITKVILSLPEITPVSNSMRKVIRDSIVEVNKRDHHAATIEMDNGAKGETENFQPFIPLTVHW